MSANCSNGYHTQPMNAILSLWCVNTLYIPRSSPSPMTEGQGGRPEILPVSQCHGNQKKYGGFWGAIIVWVVSVASSVQTAITQLKGIVLFGGFRLSEIRGRKIPSNPSPLKFKTPTAMFRLILSCSNIKHYWASFFGSWLFFFTNHEHPEWIRNHFVLVTEIDSESPSLRVLISKIAKKQCQ